jgi:hypothetical protein
MPAVVLGHSGPRVRGGAGRGPTVPQRRLLEALNARLPGWRAELAVATGSAPGSGWPTVLKLDLGHRAFKTAVEIDGNSHRALRRAGATPWGRR